MTTTKIISTVSAVLVALLAIGAFVLSYDALRHVALDFGIAPNLIYVWPLLIDFALVVFSLAVLRANLRGEPAWWPWFLVGVFTAATVGFNLIHANGTVLPRDITRYLVAIVAPVALLLSFETLMTMVKGEITFHGLVTRLADLRRQTDTEQRRLDALNDDIAARQSDLAALHQEIEARQAEQDSLRQQFVALNDDITARQKELDDLRHQIDAARRRLDVPFVAGDATATTDAATGSDSRRDKAIERQQQVLALIQERLSPPDIAARLGVSLRTVQRDIKQLNGQVNP